jgi:tellurite resistance protein TehA-like permease
VPAPSGASVALAAPTTFAASTLVAASESNLQLTSPLVWVLIAISAAGAIVTFAFLVYAIVKFRDPKTRGRRYG